MKKCAVCGHECDSATCPMCGEASWIEVAGNDAQPSPEADESSDPAVAPSVNSGQFRGRRR